MFQKSGVSVYLIIVGVFAVISLGSHVLEERRHYFEDESASFSLSEGSVTRGSTTVSLKDVDSINIQVDGTLSFFKRSGEEVKMESLNLRQINLTLKHWASSSVMGTR